MDEELLSDPAFTSSILGTSDPLKVRGDLDSFCQTHLGSGIARVPFCELGVGAAFGLVLRDGRRIFLKANPPDRRPDFLGAVHRVQGHLHTRGFPCPEPLVGPEPFGIGFATVDELVDAGEYRDAHEPEVRRALALALAAQIRLASELSDPGPLSGGHHWPEDALWPRPHNVLFDFEATAEGAGWIDALARRAKSAQPRSAGRIAVGHLDWSAKHFRFTGERIRVVYDWDSLKLDREPVFVGFAAATFTATWYLEVESVAPSPDELRRFVEEYEEARGEPFSPPERLNAFTSAVYLTAYCARCEHALDPGGENQREGFRGRLSAHPREYLALCSSGSQGRTDRTSEDAAS